MGVMMFYEDSICIMMQQPTITTISRWPVGPLPLLYSPGTCTHCRRPLLLPVSSTAATISPPTLLSHIDLWIMKARQLIKDRMSSWWLFNPCETSCLSTSTSSSIFESMYIYIYIQYEKWVRKKELHVQKMHSQEFLQVIRIKSLRTFPSMKNSDFPRWIQKVIPFV